MKKPDIILCVVVLAAALLLLIGGVVYADRLTAHIYVRGELEQSLNIGEIVEYRIEIGLGANTVKIAESGVYMQDADCRSQDCIRMGKITRPGQIIVCLPNRVMIMLEGGREEWDVDAVAG